jgi:DNA-binding NtrC family response regulator
MRHSVALLVGSDRDTTGELAQLLTRNGCRTVTSGGTEGMARAIRTVVPDLLVLAPAAGEVHACLDAVRPTRTGRPRIPVILVVTESSEELAVAALRAGVDDYLRWPTTREAVAAAIERCATPAAIREAPAAPRASIVGETSAMREIKTYIERVAASDSTVLITGETGTGKELVAELIHASGPRRNRPFVSINCAAIPETLLESELFGHERGAFTGALAARDGQLRHAGGGTVLFDEIGDMSPAGQAKILRAIETKQVQRLGSSRAVAVDVRVIAATNQDLGQLVRERKFRRDLYFRLDVAHIHLPPLRERRADIPALLAHFVREMNVLFRRRVQAFSPDAVGRLLRHDWPGNVRELRNLVEAAFLDLPPGPVAVVDLPEALCRRLAEAAALPEDEQGRLLSALFATNWNKSRAAEALHWSRMTLYRKLAKYGVTAPGPREAMASDPPPGDCERRAAPRFPSSA